MIAAAVHTAYRRQNEEFMDDEQAEYLACALAHGGKRVLWKDPQRGLCELVAVAVVDDEGMCGVLKGGGYIALYNVSVDEIIVANDDIGWADAAGFSEGGVVFTSSSKFEGYPGYPERSGQVVEVLQRLPKEEADPVVGPMYRIRFFDGVVTSAYADELFRVKGKITKVVFPPPEVRSSEGWDIFNKGDGWQVETLDTKVVSQTEAVIRAASAGIVTDEAGYLLDVTGKRTAPFGMPGGRLGNFAQARVCPSSAEDKTYGGTECPVCGKSETALEAGGGA